MFSYTVYVLLLLYGITVIPILLHQLLLHCYLPVAYLHC